MAKILNNKLIPLLTNISTNTSTGVIIPISYGSTTKQFSTIYVTSDNLLATLGTGNVTIQVSIDGATTPTQWVALSDVTGQPVSFTPSSTNPSGQSFQCPLVANVSLRAIVTETNSTTPVPFVNLNVGMF